MEKQNDQYELDSEILYIHTCVCVDHTKYQRDTLNIIYSSNILLYMFRVSSTHLQEDTVVCEQDMAPSLSVES